MIKEDCFPANVCILPADGDIPLSDVNISQPPQGVAFITIARVVVTESQVAIGIDSSQGPLTVFLEDIIPSMHVRGPRGVNSSVVTASGRTVVWQKDEACGCGSRLRSWRPFKTVGSSKDPLQ